MFGIYIPVCNLYFIHLQGLLYSFKDLLDVDNTIYLIDLGLDLNQIVCLKNNFHWLNYKIITVDQKYKINYKFKIKCIELMLKNNNKYSILLDAKNHLKWKLSKIISYLEYNPILIQDISPYPEYLWTHDICLKNMGVWDNEEIKNSNQFQSNNPVFYIEKVRDIMQDILKYGYDDNCIAPPGSRKSFEGESRHRQDQSIISITLKKHGIKPTHLNYSTFHNTIHLV